MAMPQKSFGGRGRFQPSGCFPEPRSGLAVLYTCAEDAHTDDEAREGVRQSHFVPKP